MTNFVGPVDKHLWGQYWRSGFALSFTQPANKSNQNAIVAIIPIWSIVIPLTLLSAWLLLSKPKLPKPVIESAT